MDEQMSEFRCKIVRKSFRTKGRIQCCQPLAVCIQTYWQNQMGLFYKKKIQNQYSSKSFKVVIIALFATNILRTQK